MARGFSHWVTVFLLGLPAAAQTFVVHPRVYNDVPASSLMVSQTANSVSFSDQNVFAPSGYANRHDWRVSTDGATDAAFGPGDYFDVSADVILTGSPASPRKEAGLRLINASVGDSYFIVDTDAQEVVAFSENTNGPLPFYNFRDHGAPNFANGSTLHMRMQYLQQNGVNGFILTAGNVASPFLTVGGGGVGANTTAGGYLQVQNDPNNANNGGTAAFSNIAISLGGGPPPPPPALTDAQLLDRTEAQACAYASSNLVVNGSQAMVADTTQSGTTCSVAATGMGLVCLAIEAQRYGTTPEWTVTPADARAKANAIMDAIVAMQAANAGYAGLPYHFVVPSGSGFGRANGSEVSTADGAIMVCGALAAGQAFGAEVRTKALQIAAKVQWNKFLIVSSGLRRFTLAWRPEKDSGSSGYTVPASGGGYLNTGNWDRPTDEILQIGILAVGSQPASKLILAALYDYPRATRAYHGGNGATYSVVNSYFGSLFTYTQGHALIPYDRLGADHPEDAATGQPAVDWWQNSILAAQASRQFSADHAIGATAPDAYAHHAAFGPDSWGLTAAFNPADGSYAGLLGAPPREANGGAPEAQGIIAPYGAISALRLLRTSPTEALSDNPAFRALRHYYDTQYAALFGPYGPKESFNDAGQVADIYVGIDTGLEAMAMEDYRTGITETWFSTSSPAADGMAVLHHKGLFPADLDLDGNITVSDAALALQFAAGLLAPSPAQRYNGDVDGDGKITLADAVAIAKMAG